MCFKIIILNVRIHFQPQFKGYFSIVGTICQSFFCLSVAPTKRITFAVVMLLLLFFGVFTRFLVCSQTTYVVVLL